jgi:hypothetical protein
MMRISKGLAIQTTSRIERRVEAMNACFDVPCQFSPG